MYFLWYLGAAALRKDIDDTKKTAQDLGAGITEIKDEIAAIEKSLGQKFDMNGTHLKEFMSGKNINVYVTQRGWPQPAG